MYLSSFIFFLRKKSLFCLLLLFISHQIVLLFIMELDKFISKCGHYSHVKEFHVGIMFMVVDDEVGNVIGP